MSLLRRASQIPVKYPFAFGVGISTVKTSFSDLLVQKVVERREEVDWKRNLVFATFGCFYLGGVQYMLYVPVFSRIFPNAAKFAAKPLREKIRDFRGLRDLCGQVFLDQCVHHPLMYFPVFYLTKNLVLADEFSVSKTLSEYRDNMKEDLIALWKVWVPSTFLNFAFMPMWARIPWVAGTSLLWSCILSAMRGGSVTDSEDVVGGAVTGASIKVLQDSLHDFFACPVELDPSLSHMCLTAQGHSKVGWVSKLTREIAQNGGGITHSNMVRLGSDFIITMHIAVKPEQKKRMISTMLSNDELEPLNLKFASLTRRDSRQYTKPKMGLRVHCVGADRPGILADVSERIAAQKLLFDNVTTKIQQSPAGKREFVVNIDCVATDYLDKESLEKVISNIMRLKRDLRLDHMDVRIHRILNKDD